jgi:hypothetical protein
MNLNTLGLPETDNENILFARMRHQRDLLLSSSDWTQAHDDPTGKRDEWATYRQALRDLPSTWTPGAEVNFPDPPA